MRIYKLYKNYALSDLTREKVTANAALKKALDENKAANSQLSELREKSRHLKATIKWYKATIDNFEDEYKNIDSYLKEKRD